MFLRNFCLALVFALCLGVPALAGDLNVEVESGAVWFSRNDTRIPGDTGTKFNMLNLTGSGPVAYVRLYGTYAFNDRHALRVTIAPLEIEGTGTLKESTVFKNDIFAPNIPTKGTYKFNTYRLTYRYIFHDTAPWRLGIGTAVLIRDAEIALEQGSQKQSRDDLGLVPLLHFYGAYNFTDQLSLVLDFEGAAASPGRAIDAALKARYEFDRNWHVSVGYRTLEGGADNDDVYTFAWLHYALAEIGYSF